jgi:drug/metabolite transporter (DMT)-like permease
LTNWFLKVGPTQGILWGVMIYLIGSLNDVVTRSIGSDISFIEITFFRCLFSMITVAIPMLFNLKLFRSKMQKNHIIRGSVGSVGLALCSLGIFLLPIAENTTILFSEAFFVLPLAAIFLKEKMSFKNLMATIIGFAGIIIMFRPSVDNFNLGAGVPLLASVSFAIMSVLLKKMVNKQENNLTIIFYFGLYSSLTLLLFLPFHHICLPNLRQIGLMFLLGCGGSCLQCCVFMAFRSISATALSSIRYIELPFSAAWGYLFFSEMMDKVAIFGTIFIIMGAILASAGIKDESSKGELPS